MVLSISALPVLGTKIYNFTITVPAWRFEWTCVWNSFSKWQRHSLISFKSCKVTTAQNNEIPKLVDLELVVHLNVDETCIKFPFCGSWHEHPPHLSAWCTIQYVHHGHHDKNIRFLQGCSIVVLRDGIYILYRDNFFFGCCCISCSVASWKRSSQDWNISEIVSECVLIKL